MFASLLPNRVLDDAYETDQEKDIQCETTPLILAEIVRIGTSDLLDTVEAVKVRYSNRRAALFMDIHPRFYNVLNSNSWLPSKF
jgi:hypothetical protein